MKRCTCSTPVVAEADGVRFCDECEGLIDHVDLADLEKRVKRVERFVVKLARREPAPAPNLLTAAEVATRFGLHVNWVRAHKDDLGAIRLGTGPRPRLRYELEAASKGIRTLRGSNV